jgi:4-aminobutyrate aminotransferase-like enzyme
MYFSTFELQVVLLVDSGFEARKMAIQMARMYTDNVGMIGLSTLDSWKYPDLEVCQSFHI